MSPPRPGSSQGIFTKPQATQDSKFKLLSLANEVLDMISNHCDNASQLALAMTCQKLNTAALNALYLSVVLKSTVSMDLFTRPMGYGLTPRRLRIAKIQSLKIIVPVGLDSDYLDIVGLMNELHHLEIIYMLNRRTDQDRMILPQNLPPALISCSLRVIGWKRVSWVHASVARLLKHPTLERLCIENAVRQMVQNLIENGNGDSALKDLQLVNCVISNSDLRELLRYPRGLKYLSICSSLYTSGPRQPYADHSPYLEAINSSSSRSTLKGLRFDTSYMENVVIPMPGMHQLSGVKYLETSVDFLEQPDDTPFNLLPIPTTVCPLSMLLPPNIEVLKITPFAWEMPVLWKLVERKAEDPLFLTNLRKVILVRHFRDQSSSDALIQASTKCMKCMIERETHIFKEWDENFPPFTDVAPIDRLEAAFKKVGVMLISIFSDDIRKEVLQEPAVPPVWELFSQS